MKVLVRLYPRPWRDRYEEEFLAVLEARPIGPFDAVDIVLGALDARRRAVRRPRISLKQREIRMSTRSGGLAALATGLLWFALIAGAIAHPTGLEWISAVVVALLVASLIVAIVGLGASQGRAHPVATWMAIAVSVGGAVVMVLGFFILIPLYDERPVLGDLSGWWIGTIGAVAVLAGAVLFGAVTILSRVLSRWAAALIAIGGVGILVLAMFGTSGPVALPEIVTQILLVSAVVAFGIGWLWLGRTAIQATPRPA